MGQLIFHGPTSNLRAIEFKTAQAQDLAGRKAVGSWRFTGKSFLEQSHYFCRPARSMIATRELGLPSYLPALPAGAQIIAIEFIKAAFAQLQLIQSLGEGDLLATKTG
jgi:hypothetical protein